MAEQDRGSGVGAPLADKSALKRGVSPARCCCAAVARAPATAQGCSLHLSLQSHTRWYRPAPRTIVCFQGVKYPFEERPLPGKRCKRVGEVQKAAASSCKRCLPGGAGGAVPKTPSADKAGSRSHSQRCSCCHVCLGKAFTSII